MEIVNTTTVSPEDAIAYLLDRRGLEHHIGRDACACFLVGRAFDATELYERLIRNVAAIDATTRRHIAFIVFYGESSVYARASDYHEPYQVATATLPGLSSSTWHGRFDGTFGTLFRQNPEGVSRPQFEHAMSRAATALMDRLELRESDTPCLVFVDPANTSNRHVVRLNGGHAMDFLYFSVLSPLSDAFRDLQSWVEIRASITDLESLADQRRSIAQALAARQGEDTQLRNAVAEAEAEVRRRAAQEFPWEVVPREGGLQLTDDQASRLSVAIGEWNRVNEELRALSEGSKAGLETGPHRLRRLRLEKVRKQVAQRLESLTGVTHTREAKKRLAECEKLLRRFMAEQESYEAILARIPADIDDRVQAATKVLAKRSAASSARGYDWVGVSARWPRSRESYCTEARVGPRAFGVVRHVLESTGGAGGDPQLARPADEPRVVAELLRRERTVVFISYRRADAPDAAGRIYDRLTAHLGRDRVFKDVDSIPLAVPFPEWLRMTLGRAGIMLAVIGPSWVTASAEGKRRLDDPNDYVRWEIETAIGAGIAMIPVTVANAAMPQALDLPESLHPLTKLNGQQIRPDPDFHRDMDRLISGIGRMLTARAAPG
jgi:hypothetical protein